MITVASIVYKPETSVSDPEDHYLRVPLTSAALVVGHGIEGDRKGGHPDRQLNLMSAETLQALAKEGFHALPGQMGEQIAIQGLDLSKLKLGDRLQIGDKAVVEIASHRTGCDHFERIQGKPRGLAAGRLGVMARVVEFGTINVGSPVKLLPAEG